MNKEAFLYGYLSKLFQQQKPGPTNIGFEPPTDQQVGEAQEKRKSRLLRKSLGYTRGGWKA